VSLAQAGCRIICDDVVYPDESPFQDGIIAQAVNRVCAMGVLYFSCAANFGNVDSLTSSTWQGDFVADSAITGGTVMQFAPGHAANEILSDGGYTNNVASLFWSDPLGAATNDYDLYLAEYPSGNIVLSSTTTHNGTQDPYQGFPVPRQYENSSNFFTVFLGHGTTNRFLHLDFQHGTLDYYTAGSSRGHNACDAPNSFTVAATPAATANGVGNPTGPYPNAFNASDVVEYFSSDGPRRMFYNPDGTPITPGNFTSTGGRVLSKPDFTAADGVSTTPPGFAPFFGTSCATPHAAAIAALVLSYNPGLTPDQVRTVLTNSCIDIMAPGWDRDSGYGILMALAALQHTPPPNYFVPGSAIYSKTGGFQVTLAGVFGSMYKIHISTDLQTWSTLATITMTNSTSIFTDATSSSARRYYRAQLQ
jgi:subtilisin family serine protease